MVRWVKQPQYDSEVERKKAQMSDYIIRLLKAQKQPISERQILTNVYLFYNENVPYTVISSLKKNNKITIEGGKWSIS